MKKQAFFPGDRISFINEKLDATVFSVKPGGKIVVITDDELKIEVLENEIVLFKPLPFEKTVPKAKAIKEKENIGTVHKIILDKDEKFDVFQNFSKAHRKNQDNVLEIDLHAHHIIENFKGLSNFEIMNRQINYFQYHLEKSIAMHYNKVIFIHGVGDGVLKTEIRRILKNYPGIRFHDASFKKYGFGATEVEIL